MNFKIECNKLEPSLKLYSWNEMLQRPGIYRVNSHLDQDARIIVMSKSYIRKNDDPILIRTNPGIITQAPSSWQEYKYVDANESITISIGD